ncbi:uncharacterized protein LOC144662998 [Oculina patagonica]
MAKDQATLLFEGRLDFDDDTLRAIAQVYLEDGNKEYKKKQAYNAIYFFTEGIQVNCKDDNLNAKLYSNRATAHLHLGNYQKTLNDATAAVELEPTFVKAIERGASACVQLQRYKEAMAWCEKGLAINKNSKTLLDLWNRCSQHNTLQEAKSQEMKSMPDIRNVNCQKSKKELDCHERKLRIPKEVGDKLREGTTYGNLGDVYYRLGDFKIAIDYFKRLLKIAKEVGDKAIEGGAYGNLGNAYKSLGYFKTAIEYHERHLKIAKEVGDKVGEGMAYGNLGNAYRNQGNFKTAIDYHERNLKIAKEVGDKTGEGTTYGNLGTAYRNMGNFKRAIDYHNLHLKIAKEVGDKAGEGRAYGNLGITYRNLGEFNTAIDHHKCHLKIVKDLRDKAGEGKVYCNLGNAYYSLGDFKTAVYYHERDLKFAKEVGDNAGQGRAYGNLGDAYHSLGDFKTAVDYHERSLKIFKEVGDKAGEGRVYNSLGNDYISLGDYKTAIDYHERNLKFAKEVGDKAGEGGAYGNLGNAYNSLGDFRTAIDYHERHLKIAKDTGDKAGEGMAYGSLGNAYHSLEDFESAVNYHKRHLKISTEIEDKSGKRTAYCNLGNAYDSLGDLKTAIENHERGLKIANDAGDKTGMATLLYGLGRSLELQGSPARALDCFHSSVEITNAIRHRLEFKDEWKISYRDMYKAVYTSLWRLLTKQGKVVEALFAADQGRAQALNDLMELNYGFDAASFSSHTPHKSTYDLLRFLPSNTVLTVFLAANVGEIVFWVLQKGNDVKMRRKELSDSISLDVDMYNFVQSLNVIAFEEIGARTTVKCENRSFDKLEDEHTAKDWSPKTRTDPVPLHTTALRTFYDVIIEPIADLVQGNELVLVPEGPLCLAPYAVVMSPDSRFLCESFRIRVIPSLTSLKLIVDCPDDYHSKTGVLLVGDPWVQEVLCHGTILEQLPWARKEVKMIGRILNTAPLIGREATKDEVLKRISSVALVHIAAHGRMETGEIALAPNTTKTSQICGEEDFLLTMRDVMSVQIRARLVVLSCCHSARGEIKAEGVVGIARAFLAAGARSVLVSLWAIDDEATLEFMKCFYSHLVTGRSASESLNLAMKCMRESDEFSEVKYWAPFVLIGDDVTLNFDGSD